MYYVADVVAVVAVVADVVAPDVVVEVVADMNVADYIDAVAAIDVVVGIDVVDVLLFPVASLVLHKPKLSPLLQNSVREKLDFVKRICPFYARWVRL